MRCCCCNRLLSDYESTLRHPVTLEFTDICMKCMPDTGIKPIEGSITNEDSTVYEEDLVDFEMDIDEDGDDV